MVQQLIVVVGGYDRDEAQGEDMDGKLHTLGPSQVLAIAVLVVSDEPVHHECLEGQQVTVSCDEADHVGSSDLRTERCSLHPDFFADLAVGERASSFKAISA